MKCTSVNFNQIDMSAFDRDELAEVTITFHARLAVVLTRAGEA